MKVLLLAGEESGLLYAKGIAERLRARCPAVEIRGYGDFGFETDDLAVIGFWAVIRRLGYFLRVKRTLERCIDEWRPDVVCTVDYPGLNLKLAAYAKSRGIRAVHVVSPQVWAWKRSRIPKIEAALDRLCCFFPFEPALYRPGFAEFVGHPLAATFAALPPPPARSERTVALLPGSRRGEIERILPTLLKAARLIDTARFVIPAANDRARSLIDAMVARLGAGLRLEVRTGGAREILRMADAAAVASGTATLEAALAACPTVLVYRVNPLTAWLARRVIKGVRFLGLANIVADKAGVEPPMPELLQEAFTAEATAEWLKAWLNEPALRSAAVARLKAATAPLSVSGDPLGNVIGNLL